MSKNKLKRYVIHETQSSDLCPEERLANAVVMQAVIDYRSALKALRKRTRAEESQRTKYDCERFFKSREFTKLCALDGEALMLHVQRETMNAAKLSAH